MAVTSTTLELDTRKWAARLLTVLTWASAISHHTLALLPDEMECPQSRQPAIEHPEYWVPYGIPYRAWRTLPWRWFVIKPSSIPKAGLGVFVTSFISKNTWLGEYEGEIIGANVAGDSDLMEYAWNGYTDDVIGHYIDGIDPTVSNWLRFVNCPNNERDVNVASNFCYGRTYYRITRDLYPGQELFIYYGDYYASQLGIYDTYYN